MSPDKIFQLCSSLATFAWIILLIFPKWYAADKFVIGIIITLFALVYTWLIFSHFDPTIFQKFGSLAGVMELFKIPEMVTAGWVHYLAFDLMTGLFIRNNARKYGISHWLIIIPLFFTFMFGPFGLLLYLIIRYIVTKNYFADNY